MFVRTAETPYVDGLFLKSGEISFARYKHETAAHKKTVFIHENSLVYVLEGHKKLHTPSATLTAEKGKLLLIKRGVYVMSEFIQEGLDYQALVIYFSDDFIRQFCLKHISQIANEESDALPHLILSSNALLDSFKDQYLSYFRHQFENLESILRLKLDELFLLLLSGKESQEVRSWLNSIAHEHPLPLEGLMKKYLFHPLTLTELARLSGRSLASFKRDFNHQYNATPKKWIHHQRLLHSRMLLQNGDQNVSEVAYECGFENIPYFIRSFKKEFGITPNASRSKVQ